MPEKPESLRVASSHERPHGHGDIEKPNGNVKGDCVPRTIHRPATRIALLAVANSVEFGHLPPSQIVPRLADQNRYIGSESTFYRVLREAGQLTHRRLERRARKRGKPLALSATEPNQLFTWDISRSAPPPSG